MVLTGIGDVISLASHARAPAGAEMFVGLIYLATIVARLIGFTVNAIYGFCSKKHA